MTILLFHTLRHVIGMAEITLSVERPLAPRELWDLLTREYPVLESYRKQARMACNQTYVAEDTIIHPDDEIALIPPVSGG